MNSLLVTILGASNVGLRPSYTMRLNSTVELSWGQSYSVAGSKAKIKKIVLFRYPDRPYLFAPTLIFFQTSRSDFKLTIKILVKKLVHFK